MSPSRWKPSTSRDVGISTIKVVVFQHLGVEPLKRIRTAQASCTMLVLVEAELNRSVDKHGRGLGHFISGCGQSNILS